MTIDARGNAHDQAGRFAEKARSASAGTLPRTRSPHPRFVVAGVDRLERYGSRDAALDAVVGVLAANEIAADRDDVDAVLTDARCLHEENDGSVSIEWDDDLDFYGAEHHLIATYISPTDPHYFWRNA